MAGTRNKSCFGQHRPTFEIFLSFSTIFLPLIYLTKLCNKESSIAIVRVRRNLSVKIRLNSFSYHSSQFLPSQQWIPQVDMM